MIHTLRPIAAIINYDTKTGRALFLAKLLGNEHHVTEQCLLIFSCVRELCQPVAVFGNHQKVHRGYRIDVSKRNAQIVVVDLVGRDVSR